MLKDQSNEFILFKATIKCGLLCFLVNGILLLFKLTELALISNCLVPGFIFGAILTNNVDAASLCRKAIFIVASGGLFILCSWFATNIHFKNYSWVNFPTASAFGACGLFILYKYLLNRSVFLGRGLLYCIAFGAVTGVMPGLAFDKGLIEEGTIGFPIDFLFITSIFLFWQPLFSLTIVLNSPAAANTAFAIWRQKNIG